MNVDLVFEGGGVLGINYVGALKAFEEKGYRIQRCAGTSAGSVISALIIAGYNSDELTKIIYNTDFNIFRQPTRIGKVFVVGKYLSLLFDKGKYDSIVIERWMHGLLKKKGITKFKHVMSNGESRLKVVAADITKRRMLILPDDLPRYGIDPYEYSIANAVRMSCTIPFYFTPVELKYNNKLSFIVDGGLLSSFPIWIFDVEGIPQWPTFGLKIKDLDSLTSQGRKDILAYLKDIIDAPINKDEENFIRNKDCVRTIVIDYDGKIKPTDFNRVNEHVEKLCENGYESTIRFLNNWSFNKYVQIFKN